MTTIINVYKNIFNYIILYLEIRDIQQLALTSKDMLKRVRLNEEWMDCIRRSGNATKIYDGTNIFCTKEFLKKDKTFLPYIDFRPNEDRPLNTLFVDHYMKISINPQLLFQSHRSTIDYLLQNHLEKCMDILDYANEEDFYYIIQKYGFHCHSFERIAEFGTPELLQETLKELEDVPLDYCHGCGRRQENHKHDMNWFAKYHYKLVIVHGNIKLYDACLPYLQYLDSLYKFIKIENIGPNHVPFIELLIKHCLLKKNHVIGIASQTTNPRICEIIYEYYIKTKSILKMIEVVAVTGNEYLFRRVLTYRTDSMETFMKGFISIRNRGVSLGAVFRLMDGLRYRLRWLKTLPIQHDANFAHVWSYIHDTHGKVAFLETFDELKKTMIVPVYGAITKWYHEPLSII